MEAREQEVKLFGKNISMHENSRSTVVVASGQISGEGGDSSSTAGDSLGYDGRIYDEGDVVDEDELENDMDCPAGNSCENAPEGKDQNSSPDKSESSESVENYKSSQVNDDPEAGEQSKNGKEKGDGTNSQPKTLKKPDKILPCPRCNSMDTKFCYYNNYNVNQPRHFCKSCQRYWTAGGTMRNVPVGAGRRKNKNSSSHSHHITISEALEANIKPNGTVLSFGGHDSPLCESMAPNGYFKLEQGIQSPGRVGENVDDCSSGSTVTTSSSMVNENGFPSWPYPMQFYHSGYPIQFYPPPPYWNCGIPGPWSYPWMPAMSPASNQKSSGSDPYTPTLGKRSNDGELERKQSPEKKRCEGSVLVPKTLRIDDPDEAAKSSIWTTLGIKYDSINKGSIFNAFQSKPVNHVTMPSSVLQANPAALTRSFSFREKARV